MWSNQLQESTKFWPHPFVFVLVVKNPINSSPDHGAPRVTSSSFKFSYLCFAVLLCLMCCVLFLFVSSSIF